MSLGEKLKQARNNKGYTQVEAAKLLGITNGALSGYERNYRDPDTTMLKKLSDLYNVSLEWLLNSTVTSSPQISKGSSDDQAAFEKFMNDPNLEVFYKELPKSDEEEIEQLREFWEFIKSKKKWDMSNRVFYSKYTWQYFSLLELYRYIRTEETYGLYF